MIHEIHEIHEIGAIDTKATGQMLLRRFQHNCGCARTLQKSERRHGTGWKKSISSLRASRLS